MKFFALILFSALLLLSCKTNKSEKEAISMEKLSIEDFVFEPIQPIENPPIRIDYDTSIWVEFLEDDRTTLDIRYATSNNFMNQQIYDCGRCFLEKETAEAMQSAILDFRNLGYATIFYDCYRPQPFQQKLWNIKPDARYVTPPSKGSMHSRGMAIDMGLIDKSGTIIDMGTAYDFFGPEAHYAYKNLSDDVQTNRRILRETMEKHGFKGIRTEWWHFSYKKSIRPLSRWTWNCFEDKNDN